MHERQALVAIMNNPRDFARAQREHWYRIPVKSAPKRMNFDYLAFYQTKIFGEEKWSVNYYAEVKRREIAKRIELIPEEPEHERAQEEYYRLEIGDLQRLPRSIPSKRWRRIVFIPTTLEKLLNAEEINDLWHESPLEDKLWLEFKKDRIEAERQYYVGTKKLMYCLDFAIFCQKGHIDVECDGDTWHTQKEAIVKDNIRNNFLASRGWSVLRFGTRDIVEHLPRSLGLVKDTIKRLDGLLTVEGYIRSFPQGEAKSLVQLPLW